MAAVIVEREEGIQKFMFTASSLKLHSTSWYTPFPSASPSLPAPPSTAQCVFCGRHTSTRHVSGHNRNKQLQLNVIRNVCTQKLHISTLVVMLSVVENAARYMDIGSPLCLIFCKLVYI